MRAVLFEVGGGKNQGKVLPEGKGAAGRLSWGRMGDEGWGWGRESGGGGVGEMVVAETLGRGTDQDMPPEVGYPFMHEFLTSPLREVLSAEQYQLIGMVCNL